MCAWTSVEVWLRPCSGSIASYYVISNLIQLYVLVDKIIIAFQNKVFLYRKRNSSNTVCRLFTC